MEMKKPSLRTGVAAALGIIATASGVIGGTNILANNDGKEGYREMVAYATNEQADVLEDGEVTREEYDRAFASQIACFDETGVPYQEPVFNEETQKWEAHIGPIPRDSLSDIMANYDDCSLEHFVFVASVWSTQLDLEPGETIEERFE